ncbi:MAG: hypothetical protein ACK4MF_01700 [Hyphomicrobiaceae bacterium]
MAGMALRDRDAKRAFLLGLMKAGHGADTAKVDELAAKYSEGINQIWLWDTHLAAELSAIARREIAAAAAAAPQQSTALEPQTATEPAFDPFAFSAVVVLSRQGRSGLMKRLADIDDITHLKQFAEAQHIAVDSTLTDRDALCEAILRGAEQRIADRRAAAS